MPGSSGSLARWPPRSQERLRPPAVIDRIRTVPDQGLRRDVHLTWPGKGAVVHVHGAEGIGGSLASVRSGDGGGATASGGKGMSTAKMAETSS